MGVAEQSPRSYWHVALDDERTHAVRSVEVLPRSTTIAIVGEGLLGISTAYFLARSGVDVLVLDRDGIAAGATGRNAGFVVSGAAESYPTAMQRYGADVTRAVHRFTVENRALLRQVLEHEGIDCDYREQGYLGLATNDDDWKHYQETHEMLLTDGVPSQLLQRDELQARIGVLLKPHIVGARYAPDEGQIHPVRLLDGLARCAVRGSVRFAFPYTVNRIVSRQDSCTLVVTDGTTEHRVEAERVLCATNAWLPTLVPSLRDKITPVRGQVICTTPMQPLFPCGMSAEDGLQYWQQLPDGRIILGGGRMAVADREVGYTEPMLRSEVQTTLDSYLHTLFDGIGTLTIERRWSGIMGFSQDALPYIGGVPGQERLFVAGGFTGHGMPFGLRAGQALSETLLSGMVSSALIPFRLDRPVS